MTRFTVEAARRSNRSPSATGWPSALVGILVAGRRGRRRLLLRQDPVHQGHLRLFRLLRRGRRHQARQRRAGVGSVGRQGLRRPVWTARRCWWTSPFDNGVELGDRTEAAIKTETVLGTKMLELTPRGDGELTGTIPLERTKSPYDLPTALGDLTTTISGLDTTQLSSVAHHVGGHLQGHATRPEDRSGGGGAVLRHPQHPRRAVAQPSGRRQQGHRGAGQAQRSDRQAGRQRQRSADRDSVATRFGRCVDEQPDRGVAPDIRAWSTTTARSSSPRWTNSTVCWGSWTTARQELQRTLYLLRRYAMSFGEVLGAGPFFKASLVNLAPGQFSQPFIDARRPCRRPRGMAGPRGPRATCPAVARVPGACVRRGRRPQRWGVRVRHGHRHRLHRPEHQRSAHRLRRSPGGRPDRLRGAAARLRLAPAAPAAARRRGPRGAARVLVPHDRHRRRRDGRPPRTGRPHGGGRRVPGVRGGGVAAAGLRNSPGADRQRPAEPVGRPRRRHSFLWAVGSESVAVAAAALAQQVSGRQLPVLALVCWGIGLVQYLLIAGMVLGRLLTRPVEPRSLMTSSWIFMGAAAITVLAGTRLLALPSGSMLLSRPLIAGSSVVLWSFSTWLIPLLLALGVWRHVVRKIPSATSSAGGTWCSHRHVRGHPPDELGRTTATSWIGRPTLGRWKIWVGALVWLAAIIAMATTTVRATSRPAMQAMPSASSA